MPSLLTSDTPGDRKEIRSLLHALPPLDRVRFLCECCLALNVPGTAASARGMPLAEARRCDVADEWVTAKVYYDLVFMATQHGMCWDTVLARLSEHVKRPAGLRESPAVRAALKMALAVKGETG